MKNIILSLLFFTITFSVFSQEGFQDSFAQKYGIKQYEDVKTKMFISKVVEAEGKSQKDLMTLFKNWASISFVNLKEVIVSETDKKVVLGTHISVIHFKIDFD